MDLSKQYKAIQGFVFNRLRKDLHDRHFEDCVQHIAMESFATKKSEADFEQYGLSGMWEWYFANYCRQSGLNRNGKSKQSAMTLEMSVFVGLSSDEDGDAENFQLMERATARLEECKGEIETVKEALSPIFRTDEIYRWAMSHYKKGKYLDE